MRRLAVLSLHTSPLTQPGAGDGGGMNVYVRELCAALARSGVECDVFTRAWAPDLAPVVDVEPGLRVHHVVAGPRAYVAKEDLPDLVGEFTDRVLTAMTSPWGGEPDDGHGPFEAVHANYWLSGLSGHVIKHELDLPLVCTFHTLDRVKAEAVPEEVQADVPHRRAEAEAMIIGCSDAVLASCDVEAEQIRQLYGADPRRIEVVPPGLDHAIFGPGFRPQARRALGLSTDDALLLFVGRIQPLKGADVAVRALHALRRAGRPFGLAVVGGPSGPHGEETYEELRMSAKDLGIDDVVWMVPPQPHELLSTFYRAADVCVVPSRSESFGLVALEAAACGTPVVASAVGGLTTLVEEGRTGFLVDDPTPQAFAERIERIVDDPSLARQMSLDAASMARRYTWRGAAARLLAIHDALVDERLVQC
ncbi:MAG TPA: glycosyltransferase [Acidimicrobiales bacterium]|jgi:D-inositol-3-phosphate glycosyltransferase